MRTNEHPGVALEPLSVVEDCVLPLFAESRDELVELVGELIACDTTAREPGEGPRDEERLQRILAGRLRAIGADVDLWEPAPIAAGHPFGISPGLDFHGRPQLAARVPGTGGGRSLLLNGHVDAVDVASQEGWSSDPFAAHLRDGFLYGRGAADMKGGLAALVIAIETLHRADVRLRGDIVLCANTDEESSGAGGWAAVEHGVSADAGICGEPTGFNAWTACRGATTGVLRVRGRAGHAELPQPDWRQGGAVNAIEKALPLIQSMTHLREQWRTDGEQRHPLLSAGAIVPTIVRGGTWSVIYPDSCEVVCDLQYLPGRVDATCSGRLVQQEVMDCVGAVAAQDPWLVEHPPEWQWIDDCPPAEVSADHEIVATVLDVARDLGREGRVAGLDSWHDAATFTLLGHTPTISFGPGGFETAHAVDERVPVDDLVDYSAAIALTLLRWCGVARQT